MIGYEPGLGARRKSILGTEPVSLMRLVEIDEAGTAVQSMKAQGHTARDIMTEPKFNGWLVQIVNGRIWSRRGKELTRKFPDIARHVSRLRGDHLLGELVYWGDQGYMEEPAVTHVAGTKDPEKAVAKLRAMPGWFQVALFDIIAEKGRDISDRPTADRRAVLETVAPPDSWDLALSPVYDFSDWKDVYDQNVCMGGDGVVLKNAFAPYTWRPLGEREARPSGTWWKLKPTSVDDFLVIGTHRGPKGRLIVELAQLHQGKPVFVSDMSNIARKLEPIFERRARKGVFVVEVEYQSRFPDPPGALQHPRLVRIREDKNPRDVTLPDRYIQA